MNARLFFAAAALVVEACATASPVAGTPPVFPAGEILDSLQVGRKRWARAGVIEYQLQSHIGCFCVYRPEAVARNLPLLTIRNGSIIARGKGKPDTPPSRDAIVEDLFEEVEDNARSPGRVIERLALHPVYGFPVLYKASYPPVPDDWIWVVVDSFAVVRKR